MAARVEPNAEPIPGYTLISRLGGGGFGEVWKAVAPGGLHKAIKFVYGDLSGIRSDGARAEQELKALNRVKTVRHPYILSLERVDIVDGQLMIVMELADRNLWDRFKECRAEGLPGIPREELISYMTESAEALDLMNNQYGLQHLDIKPQNLFLVHQHVKVADFGLVKDLEGMQASVTGGVTPVYAAPETFDGWVSRYCDQYSLAIVYQELLTGQRPFNGTNVRHLILQHMQAPPNLSSLPEADKGIIGRCLSKTPSDRFPTCKEMVNLLRKNGIPPAGPISPSKKQDSNAGTQPLSLPPSPEAIAPFLPTAPPRSAPIELEDLGANDDILTARLRSKPIVRPAPPPAPPSFSDISESHAYAVRRQDQATVPTPRELHGEGILFPAVVIAIGQAGMLALQRLRERVHDQFGGLDQIPSLRMLVIDTDPDVLRTAARGRPGAALGPGEVLLTPLHRPSHYIKPRDGKLPVDSWLDPKMVYRIPRSQVPCGVRALGRLAFCDNYRTITRRIQQELETVLAPDVLQTAGDQTGLGFRGSKPRVYILAGLAGGTGSGMFLDLAYTLRDRLRGMGHYQPDVVGLFFVPPVNGIHSRGVPLGNTCAALTEIAYHGTPGHRFKAKYLEKDATIDESEPPFSRYTLVRLPEESDEVATEQTLERVGEWLFRELCSPLGRAADLCRAGTSGPPWESRGLRYSSFGLHRVTWPRRQMLRTLGRRVGQKLVHSWMSKDARPVQRATVRWVDEFWETHELGADCFIRRLDDACGAVMGSRPDEFIANILRPLTTRLESTPEQKAAGRGNWLMGRSPEPAADLSPETVSIPLDCLVELVGRPGDESGTHSQVEPVVMAQAEKLAIEWGQKLAELPVRLIEQPGFRLAGAEEGARHAVELIEKVLHHHEPLLRDLTERARDAYEQLLSIHDSQRRATLTLQRVVELLRTFAKSRYQSLVLNQMLSAFVGMRGHLTDALREVNYCRVRLSELHKMLEVTEPPRSTVGETLFPSNCRSVAEAVDAFLKGVDASALLELDMRFQPIIQSDFSALVHICLNSAATILRGVERALRKTTEGFVAEQLHETNVAEIFLERYSEEQAALDQIATLHEEAAPSFGREQKKSEGDVCVISAPEGPGGDQLRRWANLAAPGAELVVGDADTILIYREQAYLPLADIEYLDAEHRQTYQQMCETQHFTPHTRTDIDYSR